MYDVSMKSIEEGIEPDIKVTTNKTDTKDEIIEKGIQIIHAKTSN